MNNDGLQKLKDIGAQKIYEDTHIPVELIQAILHESFDGLTKIHFVGFVSILQREYNIDLSELKNAGVTYYDERNPVEVTTEDGIFIAPKKQRNFTLLYILLAMVIFLVALYYTVEYANENMQNQNIVDNTTINNAKKNINPVVVNDANNSSQKDENKSVEDVNATQQAIQTAPIVKEEKAIPKSFQIVVRSKVWMGYIDMATNKKYQKTFIGAFDLDPNKDWFLIFGHGYIDVITGAKQKKFNSKKTLRLLYKDGQVTELSLDEFKRLNRGNAW
jgi:archaellum component FlaF (FlaF/FlaG flagellin family)